jgi:hypothetical protein
MITIPDAIIHAIITIAIINIAIIIPIPNNAPIQLQLVRSEH